MKIAYVGTKSGTSLQRARSLQRVGHYVNIIDPWSWLQYSAISTRIHFHTGYSMAGILIDNRLINEVKKVNPDLIWVNQGEFLGESVVKRLREFGAPIINYANDNPFSVENRRRFHRYRAAIPYYDLIVVVFEHIVDLAKKYGARKVIRKYISADEVAHLQLGEKLGAKRNYNFDVLFVGTWMKERGSFIAELINHHVPITIFGDQWHKAKEWQTIKPYWRGPGVYDEIKYAELLRSAKICLGLVNKSSGNLHTDRSIQIPALETLLCAERTSEHLALYKENIEAFFWSNVNECATICKELLRDEERIKRVAHQGHLKAMSNNLFNEPVLTSIINEVSK